MAALFGPFMVLIFCLSQAFRDVYFANIFQGLDFFAVIAIAFGLSAVLFGALTAARSPGDFAKLREHLGTVSAMNVTTALAWTCYFFGLKHLEPGAVDREYGPQRHGSADRHRVSDAPKLLGVPMRQDGGLWSVTGEIGAIEQCLEEVRAG
jgi:hypothetical protein